MNRNLQAFGVIGTLEVLFSDQLIPVQEFRTELKQALANARSVLSSSISRARRT